MDRNKVIVRTSLIGIFANAILVVVKMAIGFLSGSIAVVLDAVNNLTDALTSIITIIGTKLAERAPDKKHPYGYGRIEYLTTVVVAFLILIAGGTSMKESVEVILSGAKADYTYITPLILVAAIIIKFIIAAVTTKNGKLVDAHSLIVSGKEAFFDGILSVGTLFACGLSMGFGISIEGFLGAAISLAIIKSGAEMVGETISIIIGVRQDKTLSQKLKKTVVAYPGVLGVYDVILHNYGPNQHIGSIHIEVEEDMNSRQIHILTQKIMREIYESMGIIITVGIYASIHSDEIAVAIRHEVAEMIEHYPDVMQIHGFFRDESLIGFDIVIDFKADAPAIISEIENKLKQKHPDYSFRIVLDLDYSS